MTPLLSIPAVQAQPPVYSSVIGVPTQISTMKLPSTAVPATVNPEIIYNNSRGTAATRTSATATALLSASDNTAITSLMAGVDFRPSVQFSSPFLAQLFAQTPGSQLDAMAGFFVNDNNPKYTADPALMALFSQVKYKPSNASVPLPEPINPASVMKQQQQQFMQQLSEQKSQQIASHAAATTTSQNTAGTKQIFIQLPLSLSTQPARSSAQGSAGSNDGARSSSATTSTFTSKSFRSLVQPTGIDAYVASFTRNFANLNAQPEIRVAL